MIGKLDGFFVPFGWNFKKIGGYFKEIYLHATGCFSEIRIDQQSFAFQKSFFELVSLFAIDTDKFYWKGSTHFVYKKYLFFAKPQCSNFFYFEPKIILKFSQGVTESHYSFYDSKAGNIYVKTYCMKLAFVLL